MAKGIIPCDVPVNGSQDSAKIENTDRRGSEVKADESGDGIADSERENAIKIRQLELAKLKEERGNGKRIVKHEESDRHSKRMKVEQIETRSGVSDVIDLKLQTCSMKLHATLMGRSSTLVSLTMAHRSI
ncbi:hypothetical protein CALCODRAFT_272271 [Calocera cornea HHB12733]|uniref:Uncharacterized protein n=1 Tax=Calocera cornea HHB12733 TaxID=1353952 RepID=A0A165G614_9BASI|nr:hypothetical protein CALCODRAFT_272271 [Calocera cornea HHB12733]